MMWFSFMTSQMASPVAWLPAVVGLIWWLVRCPVPEFAFGGGTRMEPNAVCTSARRDKFVLSGLIRDRKQLGVWMHEPVI